MSTQNRSDDLELVRKNLELIISSNNYQLAHEDRELLNSDEMRGVRMLLESINQKKSWKRRIFYQQSSSLEERALPIKAL